MAVTKGRVIEDGVLFRKSRGGHILTVAEFEDFELEFEWKVSPGANSGVKYRFANYSKGYNGPEYQIWDDGKAVKPLSSAASLYALMEPVPDKLLEPVGRFNQG